MYLLFNLKSHIYSIDKAEPVFEYLTMFKRFGAFFFSRVVLAIPDSKPVGFASNITSEKMVADSMFQEKANN
jgi:hypothetical protein